jgi:hypothetical protein
MKLHHILRFLFVHGSTTTVLVGGLGVEDQQNELVEAPILLQMISFCVVGQRKKSTKQNQTHLTMGAQILVAESPCRLILYDGT